MSDGILYGINEGILFVLVILLFYASAEVGFLIGRRGASSMKKDSRPHVATIEAALLGLLALLLGFAFSMAMSRYDARRTVVIEEANDIGTTYLRAQFLSDNRAKIVGQLLREYVDARIDYLKAGADADRAKEPLMRTAALQKQLWGQAQLAVAENSDEVKTGYFVAALNDLIDDHTKRINAMVSHVPESILLLLIFVGAMTISMTGYSSGLSGARLVISRFILIVTTVATLTVIVDLDRPRRGLIKVSENAFLDLQQTLAKP